MFISYKQCQDSVVEDLDVPKKCSEHELTVHGLPSDRKAFTRADFTSSFNIARAYFSGVRQPLSSAPLQVEQGLVQGQVLPQRPGPSVPDPL